MFTPVCRAFAGYPPTQIRVVATATLRLAVNAGDFLEKAREILGCAVQVISGEEEARLIYQGVAHTTGGADQRLVVDIGGASTELVTGTGAQTTSLFSLSMGCVTWLERYFADRSLTKENFDQAETAAREVLRPVADVLRYHGWKVCVGASGTVQALQEIMMAQGMDERITLAKLQQLKQRAIQCGRLEELEIEGLTLERALVFPSGLAILMAIFSELNIQCMTLAGGALREGLVYGMLHLSIDQDIRSRTLRNIQRRFLVDTEQAQRVAQLAAHFVHQVENSWEIEPLCFDLLQSACQLHEIGLSVEYKQAPCTPPGWCAILTCPALPRTKEAAGNAAVKPNQRRRPFIHSSTKRGASESRGAYVPSAASGDSVCQPPTRRSAADAYAGCRR